MTTLREGGFLIAKIHQIAGRVFARMLKTHQVSEINPAQGRILFALWQQEGIPIQTLAKQTALKKSTLTSMLDRLEEDECIVRVPSHEDRRMILIHLTEKSRHWKQVYAHVSEEMVRVFYAGMSAAEIDQFESCLHRILANVTDAEEQL